MKVLLITACGCSSERELPNDYQTRHIRVPIYKRIPINEALSRDDIAQLELHTRCFELSDIDQNGQRIYREIFQR